MFCEKCGNKLEDNVRFCDKCGTPTGIVNPVQNNTGKIYNLEGARGRHLDVYQDKVVLTTKATFGSFLTGNVSDGEKTIYFVDCIGIQFKKCGFQLGYLQFETASATMNNRGNNFFNENTFTWDANVSNEKMEEVANYCKKRVDEIKANKGTGTTVIQNSPAEELKKFKELLDMGIITEDEFNAKKKQILGI